MTRPKIFYIADWHYGHVHETFEWDMTERSKNIMVQAGHNCEMYNAGAMMPWMDYTPKTLSEIWEGANTFYMRRGL